MTVATTTTVPVKDPRLAVLEGIELVGRANTSDEVVLDNIRASIRRGHPVLRRQPPNGDRILLVGSGPSLPDTLEELVALHHAGGKIVALNGSYQWLLSQHLRPSMLIMLDARHENARFVDPPVPQCRYAIASQCHPAVWDRLEGRDNVWIWHAMTESGVEKPVLDEYYLGRWEGIGGGTTVATRALSLLRALGYLSFDLFGIDSCFRGEQHHAFPQAENDKDRRYEVEVSPVDDPTITQRFHCAPWHLKQFEDVLQWVRVNGHLVQMAVHGDGLIAHALMTSAALTVSAQKE